MKNIFFMAAFCAVTLLSCSPSSKDETPVPVKDIPVPSFVKGADISWASEMEADGYRFQKKDGSEAPLLDVLKDCGVNAIRLRVWVNPYTDAKVKAWNGKADVLAVAKKVRDAGLPLMIDFHYGDFFADPSHQQIPQAWEADKADIEKMCKHVADHTVDVLKALYNAGVCVNWVQVGNETHGGMLFGCGDTKNGFGNYVKLSNAGYDAVKAIYPKALVMPHLNNAFDAAYNNKWFENFRNAGGKMDLVALSHYPQYESDPAATTVKALAAIPQAALKAGVKVMISEVGVKTPEGESVAKDFMESFMQGIKEIDSCAGAFYWEPEVDGEWIPSIYKSTAALLKFRGEAITWPAYRLGAFTRAGNKLLKPGTVMDAFTE